MGPPLQAGDVALARTGPPLDLSEEMQAGLMAVIIVVVLVVLWRSWR